LEKHYGEFAGSRTIFYCYKKKNLTFKRNIVNYDTSCVFKLVINVKSLSMSVSGTSEIDFKKKYSTFDEHETDYC